MQILQQSQVDISLQGIVGIQSKLLLVWQPHQKLPSLAFKRFSNKERLTERATNDIIIFGISIMAARKKVKVIWQIKHRFVLFGNLKDDFKGGKFHFY